MSEQPEPAENISGGPEGGGASASFAPGESDTRAEAVVDRLGERYWQKSYGGQDAFTCLVRTVLSQNTSDKASQPAHDALLDRFSGDDLAVALAAADVDVVATTIQPAGLYNQKAGVLTQLAKRIVDEYGGSEGFDSYVKDAPADEVRDTLLGFEGVGPKTADCVLLFSSGRPGVFPVDTHVHRIYRRLGIAPPDADHEAVREVLEREVPAEKCGFGHTATIQFGREFCTARKPACLEGPEACPLYDLCDRVGVDEVASEVVDPMETTD